jgi:hypothetical protein
MAPTESTQPNTASGAETRPRQRTEVERVAQSLTQRGFDTTLQTEGGAVGSESTSRYPSIGVEVKRDERERLEEALDDIETSVPYRVVWPEETPALRGWASASSGSGQGSRTAIVTSAPANQVDASEIAERRASSL